MSEAMSGRLLVMWICGIILLLSLRSSRPSLLAQPHLVLGLGIESPSGDDSNLWHVPKHLRAMSEARRRPVSVILLAVASLHPSSAPCSPSPHSP